MKPVESLTSRTGRTRSCRVGTLKPLQWIEGPASTDLWTKTAGRSPQVPSGPTDILYSGLFGVLIRNLYTGLSDLILGYRKVTLKVLVSCMFYLFFHLLALTKRHWIILDSWIPNLRLQGWQLEKVYTREETRMEPEHGPDWKTSFLYNPTWRTRVAY